jgi:Uma2 family endonuclease
MAIERKIDSVEDFVAFALLPENSDKNFEFIYGEIVEKMPGRTTISGFSARIIGIVYGFCLQHGLPFFVSGEAGAYRINGHVLAPDFAYKSTPLIDDYPDPVPPEWVVEVISPTDEPEKIRAKRAIYVEAGILYWEVYPVSQTVEVYDPGKPFRSVNIEGELDGGDVLPNFKLAVRDIFG